MITHFNQFQGVSQMDVKARNKQVKAILSKQYGRGNVSVKGGRGTAHGWCEVYITIPRPEGCTCVPEGFYCQACKDAMNGKGKEAESLLSGVEFYKYPDDMGGDNKELLIQVSIK
jgi:hypothetical protein